MLMQRRRYPSWDSGGKAYRRQELRRRRWVPGKAASMDEVPSEMVKVAAPLITGKFVELCRVLLDGSAIQDLWRTVRYPLADWSLLYEERRGILSLNQLQLVELGQAIGRLRLLSYFAFLLVFSHVLGSPNMRPGRILLDKVVTSLGKLWTRPSRRALQRLLRRPR